MEQLKEKVRELRKRRGWSQEDLAREIMLASPGFNVGRRRGLSLLVLPAGNLRGSSKRLELMVMSKRGEALNE